MSARPVEERLRRFLLGSAAFVFAGTVVELLFIGHAEDPVQFLPYALAGLGLAAALAAFYAPRRPVLRALRGVMTVVVLGSLFGLYEHLVHNFAFELEIRPGSTATDVFWDALGGASPLLSPGILALAGALALAATYAHPQLRVTSAE